MSKRAAPQKEDAGNAEALRSARRLQKRRKLYELEQTFNSRESELRNTESSALPDYVTKLDILNNEDREATGTAEDEVDTRQFHKASEAASYQARLLQGNAIDLTQFLKHLSARYGESSADGSASFNWISMAREAGGIWRRVPRMSLLPENFAAMDVAPKKQQQQRRRDMAKTVQGNGETVQGQDSNNTQKEEARYKNHHKICKKIRKLQNESDKITLPSGTKKRGVPLIPTLFHPGSFSRTTEHIFYLSFAVKSRMASIFLSKDDELCVGIPDDPKSQKGRAQESAPDDDESNNQFVFSLDFPMFEELKRLYGLTGRAPKIDLGSEKEKP